MTDAEWELVATTLDSAWRGEMDEERASVYRTMLQHFSADEVAAACYRLVENPKPFVPTVPEIIEQIRKAQEPPLPSWTEAWAVIYKSLTRGSPEKGFAYLEGHHPLIGAFVQTKGWTRLSQTPFDDPEYGELRVKDLGQGWEDFCETAKERAISGRALEARTGSSQGQPTRLDALAATGLKPPKPKELESGELRGS